MYQTFQYSYSCLLTLEISWGLYAYAVESMFHVLLEHRHFWKEGLISNFLPHKVNEGLHQLYALFFRAAVIIWCLLPKKVSCHVPLPTWNFCTMPTHFFFITSPSVHFSVLGKEAYTTFSKMNGGKTICRKEKVKKMSRKFAVASTTTYFLLHFLLIDNNYQYHYLYYWDEHLPTCKVLGRCC